MENKENGMNKMAEALKKTVLNGITLGYEIGKLQSSFGFNQIVDFIKGNTSSCYCFDILKPLYDKFGYEITNNAILHITEVYKIEKGD